MATDPPETDLHAMDDDAPTKELKFGQTPWDDLSHEELQFEVRRMYAAMNAAHHVLLQCALRGGVFWDAQTGGMGGKALAMTSAVVEPLYDTYSAEALYRTWFRYGTSLLFPELEDHAVPWLTVDGRRFIQSRKLKEGDYDRFIGGPLRRVTFDDLKPRPEDTEPFIGGPLRRVTFDDLKPRPEDTE